MSSISSISSSIIPQLPNEIWVKIFGYHRRKVRKLAAKLKKQLHDELKDIGLNYFLYWHNIDVPPIHTHSLYYEWPNWLLQPKQRPIYQHKKNKRYYIKTICPDKFYIDVTCAYIHHNYEKLKKQYEEDYDNNYDNKTYRKTNYMYEPIDIWALYQRP